MTGPASSVRTLDDVRIAAAAIGRHFACSEVFVIGSQGILLSWPDAPAAMRTSDEVDAYPANARAWEAAMKSQDPEDDPEASEEIAALFGQGSDFHAVHGFYVDGVDEHTARLPDGWKDRAVTAAFGEVSATAPCAEDLIVSKLARLADKDRSFVEAYHAERPLDLALLEERVAATRLDPEVADRAVAWLRRLTATPQPK